MHRSTPIATTFIKAIYNFDSRMTRPSLPFLNDFTPDKPVSPYTYSCALELIIYDGFGEQHCVYFYFVPTSESTYCVHIGIDGVSAGTDQSFSIAFNEEGHLISNSENLPKISFKPDTGAPLQTFEVDFNGCTLSDNSPYSEIHLSQNGAPKPTIFSQRVVQEDITSQNNKANVVLKM